MNDRIRAALWADKDVRIRTVLIAAFVVACIAYLAVVYATGITTEVMRDRYWKNAEPIFSGVFPATEYPPLAMVFFAVPRLFGTTEWGYEVAYTAQMCIYMVIGLFIVDRMAVDSGRSRSRAMCVYALLVLLFLEFVLDRFDMIVAVFILASLMFFLQGRSRLSFLMLAVATLLKVVPIILFPILVISMMSDGRRKEAMDSIVIYVATGAIVMAAFWLISPDSVTSFLSSNGSRPLQVESIPAAILYPFSMLGFSDMWIQSATSPDSFFSDNLRGGVPDAVASLMLPLAVISVALVWLIHIRNWRRKGSASGGLALGFACAACMMMLMATNKVYSSQYLIWAFPAMVLVDIYAPRDLGRKIMEMFLVVIVLTQLNFAYNIGYLGGGDNINDLGMGVLLLRAIAHLVLLRFLLLAMVSENGSSGRDVSVPDNASLNC